jgi:hypothetical protein
MDIRVPRPLVRELRAKLRDYPEINYLYQTEESSDVELARCLFEALEELNISAPMFDEEWTFTSVPKLMIRVIIDLAVCRVLEELIIWMARNEFKYTSGNTSIQLFDRWRAYQAIAPGVRARAEQMAHGYKAFMNAERGWGSNMTEMYDAWRNLETADWVTISV